MDVGAQLSTPAPAPAIWNRTNIHDDSDCEVLAARGYGRGSCVDVRNVTVDAGTVATTEIHYMQVVFVCSRFVSLEQVICIQTGTGIL